MSRGEDTGNHPGRQVGKHRFPDSRTTMVGPGATFSERNIRGVTVDSSGAITTGRPAGSYETATSKSWERGAQRESAEDLHHIRRYGKGS